MTTDRKPAPEGVEAIRWFLNQVNPKGTAEFELLRTAFRQLTALLAENAALRQRAEAAEADGARLEFIIEQEAQVEQYERDLNGEVSQTIWEVQTADGAFSHHNLRDAIDAARQAQPETPDAN